MEHIAYNYQLLWLVLLYQAVECKQVFIEHLAGYCYAPFAKVHAFANVQVGQYKCAVPGAVYGPLWK
jgi:hypothetical protein